MAYNVDELERLFKDSLEELEKVIAAKSVVGEPITIDGSTVLPLVSVGFGWGVGGGAGGDPKGGEGSGGGTGGGGGVKPVAVIVVGKDGVKVETLHEPGWIERTGVAVGELLKKRRETQETAGETGEG